MVIVVITLQDITEDNWKDAIKLKVNVDQEKFVAPNVYTIAQSKFAPETCYYLEGIYADEIMVGFSWFGHDDEDNTFWIARFMIDTHHQGKGYGKAALLKIIDLLKDSYVLLPSEDPEGPRVKNIYISAVPDNINAKKLYEKVGFINTGEIRDGEEIFRFEI